MDIKNTIAQLYNTLSLISVRGEDVKYMAACLQCVEQLAQECGKLVEQSNTEEKAAV